MEGDSDYVWRRSAKKEIGNGNKEVLGIRTMSLSAGQIKKTITMNNMCGLDARVMCIQGNDSLYTAPEPPEKFAIL